MRVVVATESRFTRTPDGAVWTREGPAASFFARYLAAFDEVRVVARVADTAIPDPGARRVDGPAVAVWPVPHYLGPRQYLRRRPAVVRAARAAAAPGDAVVVRAPSPLGALLAGARHATGRPYAVEVTGDPYDVFAPGVVRHPLRPVLRRHLTAALRRQCRDAAAVAYVTEGYLQRRYPAAPGARTAVYSSVDLAPDAYVRRPRGARTVPGPPTLVSVGSLEQPYKGVDTLLRALARLHATGTPARLVHVGDGRCRPGLERLAADLGLGGQVHFAGMLPAGEPVRRHLDAADLFVMPSRTEGLPRALIEAMARGLPAVGTTAGGIPELLPPGDLVPPGDDAALAWVVAGHLTSPRRAAAASARNLARARDFADHVLTARRDAFYRALRRATGDAAARGRTTVAAGG
ncbi:glycosyltransferase [Jidongwangia harbinensis]|uniref:glycosyltransferase n=1 Tax=Jidongwangia harbinensis TaxID=2878561 RepID=UPI001CD9623F|nr:glycosyltransferase [Jidongwangia harbinensis]MCA2214077.1 glycosyltransferase [Jidongwangia harbinensis]